MAAIGSGTEKVPMDYYVGEFKNPKDGSILLRPIIVNRQTAGIAQVVERGKQAGFVRGQSSDLIGLFGGFCQTMKVMAEEGYNINLGWFYIGGNITGTVDDSGNLTPANQYRVNMRPAKDMKIDIDNFAFTNIGAGGIKAKVEHLSWIGSPKDLQLKKGEPFQATGKNLAWSTGCTATLTYVLADASVHTLSITPTESDFSHMKFAWPAALDDVPAGTEIVASFRLRGGNPDGPAMPTGKTVTLVTA